MTNWRAPPDNLPNRCRVTLRINVAIRDAKCLGNSPFSELDRTIGLMQVLYVMFNAPPLQSGRARQALMLAGALNSHPGVRVRAISLDRSRSSLPLCPPVLSQRVDVFQVKRVWWSILKFCVQRRIQVVHFHGHNYAVHITPLLRLLGIRVFLHMTRQGHDDPATLLDGRGSALQRLALRYLTAWIVQNPGDAIPSRNPPIVHIPNAVAPTPPRPPDAGGPRVCVLSGVICPRKGQLEVLQLFAALPETLRVGLRLRLAGSMEDDYFEYAADYVAHCRALAVGIPEVELLGHLDKTALMGELSRAHYFFAVSAAEGLSNAYLECLSQGLRPIVYANHHDPLFDTLGLAGMLVRIPAGDPAVGAAALGKALARSPWSEPLARDLHARVASRFGLDGITDRLLALYRDPNAVLRR